jgi:succinate dehydrogenase/fumarate reductase flavoprotein subunit
VIGRQWRSAASIIQSADADREISQLPTGFFGGNSTKATSGINGALTRTQVDHKIADSVKQFYDDTLKSARDKARPDLIKVLTYKSAAAVEWLQDVFNLDLTLVSRLG